MDPFIGQIMLFGGNFPPRGWAFCEGQLLQISSNSALFSILGTTYGGDGRSTFALPDLRGRAPVHHGHGAGLSSRSLGSKFGSETNTLTTGNLPAHSHEVAGSNSPGTDRDPAGAFPAASTVAGTRDAVNSYGSGSDVRLAGGVITPTGDGQAINNMQPSIAMSYCIALVGVFPSRN